MAEIRVQYEVEGKSYEGALVFDDTVSAKRPAVFVQPDWKGVCADSTTQAQSAGGTDHVMLVADMYGKGYGDTSKPQDELRAGMLAVHTNLPFTLACGDKAYAALMSEADRLGLVEPGRKAAIGFCAGAGFALEQARAGADFQALVAFHTTNPNPVVPETRCNFDGRILAIHGAEDPITPKAKMDALADELTQAEVDWQMMMFGGAVHSFCDPTVHAGPVRYDEKLCRTSYRLMRDFFQESF